MSELEELSQTEERPNWLVRLWNSTVFPEMIARRKERKRQERELDNERGKILHEARVEAIKQSKDKLKEQLIEQEVKKLTEPQQSKFGKILSNVGKDLAGSGFSMPDSNKIGNALGRGQPSNQQNAGFGNGMFDQSRIGNMIKDSPQPRPQQQKIIYKTVYQKAKGKPKTVVRQVRQAPQAPRVPSWNEKRETERKRFVELMK